MKNNWEDLHDGGKAFLIWFLENMDWPHDSLRHGNNNGPSCARERKADELGLTGALRKKFIREWNGYHRMIGTGAGIAILQPLIMRAQERSKRSMLKSIYDMGLEPSAHDKAFIFGEEKRGKKTS